MCLWYVQSVLLKLEWTDVICELVVLGNVKEIV